MKLAMIKNVVTRGLGRNGLLIKKYSPEILLGVGLVGVVGGTIMACRATLKVEGVLEDAREKVDVVKRTCEADTIDNYTEQDAKKDLFIINVQRNVNIAKLYAPAALVGSIGIASILGSYGIIKKRNIALLGAYKLVESSFKDYRKRIVERYGEEVDRVVKNGIIQTKVETVTSKEGEEDKVEEKIVESFDPNQVSMYAKFFDESSVNWDKTPGYNFMFLKGQQNYANDLLDARGHVFLNEVYDMIGIPRTKEGALVGWVKGAGDGYIDFGLFEGDSVKVRDFVNGYERSILLDFNVSGVIYDLL